MTIPNEDLSTSGTSDLAPEQIAEQRAKEQRELTLCYKRLFTSEDGQRVLADIEAKYGFHRDDYVYGCTQMDLAYRNGVKSPIRYMRLMRDAVLKPLGEKPKKTKAKSGVVPQ